MTPGRHVRQRTDPVTPRPAKARPQPDSEPVEVDVAETPEPERVEPETTELEGVEPEGVEAESVEAELERVEPEPEPETTEPEIAEGLEAEIVVRGGNATPAESAAIVAVVAAAVDDARAESELLPTAAPNEWDRSRRGLRTPQVMGSWRGFTGHR